MRRGDVHLPADVVPEVVAAPDVSEDLTGLRMDGDERAVMPVGFLLALGQLFFDNTLAEGLEVEVERRRYLQPAAADDAVAGDVFRRGFSCPSRLT